MFPTGGILPDGADAVVMIEHAEQLGGEVLVRKPVAYGENVLFFNEDFSRGDVVCARGKTTFPAGYRRTCRRRMHYRFLSSGCRR